MLLQIKQSFKNMFITGNRVLSSQCLFIQLLIQNIIQKYKVMLGRNLLVTQAVRVEASRELKEEMKEYEDACRAVSFWVRRALRKGYQGMKGWTDGGLNLAYYFGKFRDGIAQAKAQKIGEKRAKQAILIMKSRWEERKAKETKRQEILRKIQKKKLYSMFQQWQNIAKIQRSSTVLAKIRQKQALNEVFVLLRENKSRITMRRLTIRSVSMNSQSVYAAELKKKAFLGLILNKKMNKMQLILKSHRLKELKRRISIYNKSSKSFIQYRSSRLLKNCFSKWKQMHRQSMAECFLRVKTQQRYFNYWKNSLQYLISERQLQKSNECIINIFRQRKAKDLLLKIIYKWRDEVKQAKQMRYHNEVLTKYANLKSKESLLRRYFDMLKQNCINNKIKNEFYSHRLKRKVIDSLKIALCQSLHKEEKIIKFIEKVECRKYFDRIRLFNQVEKQKIQKFRLNKIFKAFTFSIVYEYYSKQKKADDYYRNNLLFKSLFTFKEKISFAKKQEYCIVYLNAIRPLQRWLKRHRLIHQRQQKEWFFKKRIIRQWRLLVIKKNSQRKLVRQFKVQDSIKPTILEEEQFQFDNIMATIAKIRKNFMAERQETIINNDSMRWPAVQTPSQQINFSYSIQNLQE